MLFFLGLFLFSLTHAYDPTFTKHCTELAQSTYCVSSTEQWNCITCDSSIKLDYVVEDNGVRALQGYDSTTNSLFVAFRGSVNIQNWLDNIQISKINPYSDASIGVEKGFYKAYNYVKPELFSNLPLLAKKYGTHNILITGHSLGAAMATLLAYDIVTLFPTYTVTYLITFGSPRVGNQEFVQSFNQYYSNVYYRITHYYDMVPHVPEEFMGYLHVSNEIWYNEDNSDFTICDDYTTEDDKCSNSCSPVHCTSTSDHLYYLNVTMGSDSRNCIR
jgi:hypothetical protein|tara:strand:+ start:212 stop:1033 length:822 start_codon:yes stop_codon:yes gene_type:complete